MRSTAGAIDQLKPAGGTLSVQRQLVVASLWTILGLAIALAALLMARRISGAFQTPLSGAAIVLAGLVTELSIFAYRELWSGRGYAAASPYLEPLSKSATTGPVPVGHSLASYNDSGQYPRSSANRSSISDRPLVLSTKYPVLHSLTDVQPILLIFILTTLVALTVLISLTIPGTPLSGLLLAWLIVIAAEITQWQLHFRPNWSSPQSTPPLPIPPPPPPKYQAEPTEPEPTEPEIPSGLIQQVTRVVEDDQESIHALIKATIAANDRLAIVHLAFCPPLADKPELTAHALDTDEADVRITQAETFGARLEIRLPKADLAQRSVMIELLGSVPRGTGF